MVLLINTPDGLDPKDLKPNKLRRLCTLMKLKNNQSSAETVVINRVLDGYRKINQNVLPEAEALWLLRWEGDSAYNFLKELNLSPANLDFPEDCYNQNWKRDEYHESEE